MNLETNHIELEEEISVPPRFHSRMEEEVVAYDINESTLSCKISLIKKLSPRIITLIFFIILFLWIYGAEGGIGITENSIFGWHALLMSIAVLICMQEAILMISSPLMQPGCPLDSYKYHIILHVLTGLCAMGGAIAMNYYKVLSPQPAVYPFYRVFSPHSWMGITLLFLWCIQFIAGCIARMRGWSKNGYKYHKFLGYCVYIIGLVTCALGFQSMQSSDLSSTSTMSYPPHSKLAQYSCACTILLILAGMSTMFSISKIN